jgi:hypothetical protein
MRRPTTSPAQQHPSTSHISRSIYTSEDEQDDTHLDQEIPWQTVKDTKRKKHMPSKDSTSQDIRLDNRHHVLTDGQIDEANTGTADLKAAKTPPVFFYGLTSLPEMRKRINEFLDEDQNTTKVWQMILLNYRVRTQTLTEN